MSPVLRHVGTAVLLATLLAPAVAGQAPGPLATVEVQPAELALDAGATANVTINVANGGNLDGALDLTGDAPEGWTVQVVDAPETVAAGATATVRAVVTAPPDAETGTSEGAVTFTASLTDGTGSFASTDTASVAAGVNAPPPPPVVAPAEVPWLLYTAALAGVAMVGSGGVALGVVRPRERALALDAATTARTVRSGSETYYRLDVTNRWRRAAIVEVSVAAAPPGWTAGTDVSRLVVEPGQTGVVCVAVRPPDTAADGATGEVVLAIHHAHARWTRHEVRLTTTVTDPLVRRAASTEDAPAVA